MKKYVYLTISLLMILLLLNSSFAMNYKWSSTIPIEYVPLSSITTEKQLNNYLNNDNIVVFYMDNDYSKKDDWKLYKLNITRTTIDKIPDYGDYKFINIENTVVIYSDNSVYRDKDGAIIYTTPKKVNNSKYKIQHIEPVKKEIHSMIPDYDGYALLTNGTFVLYPKKYIIRNKDGSITYNPPLNRSNNKKNMDYTTLYKHTEDMVPNYYDHILVNQNNVFVLYPKKYVIRNKDGILIYSPGVNSSNIPVYNITTKLLNVEKGIYEIKPKKILITNNINPENKDILDFIGQYVSKNNGTFAYINKVPPKYNQVLITGIAIQKVKPDENGDYAISIAKRKIKVDIVSEDLLKRKIDSIKALSNLLNINITYISTGSENIKYIEKDNLQKDELDSLVNTYWFKKWYNDKYTHIEYRPTDDIRNYDNKNLDILAMSYYPTIYSEKAPETFKNDPKGGYYPKTISYEGTTDVGYWKEGPTSENNFYYYVKGEPTWDSNNNENSNWYYEGAKIPNNESISNKYEYFNRWFVKNYAYALDENISGLLLYSNDKTLYDMLFGINDDDIRYTLNIDNNVDYVVIPDNKGISKEKNITIIKVPGIAGDDIYGFHYISSKYIKPYNEEFGIYVADSTLYDNNILYNLKDNYTWICSFENYAKWSRKYNSNNIYISKGSINIRNPENVKITIYTNDVNNLYKYSLKVKGSLLEDYSYNQNKLVISNPPKNILLKY